MSQKRSNRNRADQLALLDLISQSMGSETKTEEFLRQALTELQHRLNYKAVQIYRLSPYGQDVWLYLEGNEIEEGTKLPNIFSIEARNIISDTARKKQITYITNTQRGPYAIKTSELKPHIIRSEVALPLRKNVNSSVLGVLRIQSEQQADFPPADRQFLQSVARLLAITISHNQTVEQLENDLQEIKILYNLQRQKDIEGRDRNLNSDEEFGYTYNQTQLERRTVLSATSRLAAARHTITIGSTENETAGHEVAAPIQLYGETIGVLGVEREATDQEWSEDDIRLLEEVSDQVALALENARLIQQTRAQTQELTLLFAASQQLSETIDLNRIYNILTGQVITYLQADQCQVALFDASRTYLIGQQAKVRTKLGKLIDQDKIWQVLVAEDETLTKLLTRPQPLIEHLADPVTTPRLQRHQEDGIHTLVSFPLVVRNRVVGVLEVAHQQVERSYGFNELQLTQAIIAQVAVAVENALQFRKTEAALAETQKLYQISRALVETDNVEDIFRVVLDHVKEFEIDRVSISLLDATLAPDAERNSPMTIDSVTIAASWDKESNQILPVGSRISAAMFPLVESSAHPPFDPLISEDLSQSAEQDPRMDENFRLFMHEGLGAITMFSTPMFLGTEYKGVLSISTRTPHTYTEQEQRVYQTLADQAIIAIENRRLFEAVRRERDQAALLFKIDQQFNQAITIWEVQEIILGFTSLMGAQYGEIYLTDGKDFASLASTIPERRSLGVERPAELSEMQLTPSLEAAALHGGKTVIRKGITAELDTEQWPSLRPIQTAVATPLVAHHSTLRGVIIFLSNEPEVFQPEQVEMLEAIATQAIAIMENLWLLEQTATALSETELLYDASRDFNLAQQPEELLYSLAESVLTRVTYEPDGMAVALISELETGLPQRLEIVALWNQPDHPASLTERTMVAKEYSFLSQLNPHENVLINYETLDEKTQNKLDQSFGQARSILIIPLQVSHTWLGVLFLVSRQTDFVFKHQLVTQITTLAGQMAVIIQNLQLVQETQKTLYNSEVLSHLSQELLGADTQEAIYELGLEAIGATEPERGAAIFLYEDTTHTATMKLVAQWVDLGQDWPQVELGSLFSIEELSLQALLSIGKTVIARQATTDERFSEPLRNLLQTMKIHSLVAVPILLNKKIEGFILISHATELPFSLEIIRLYEDVARQVSLALENRQLLTDSQRRADLLQTAAQVSEAATGFLDLETLLTQSVNLIRDRFKFYHVSIFLVDEYEKYAVVKASTGAVGQKMLAMNHKLAVGGRSIVGTATGKRKPHIALDVGQDGVHYNNPLLPETRSEMALPLVARGKIIGALDVQSTKKQAFTPTDITILQSMANQLANAIAAALAAQERQKSLEHNQKLNEYYLREQWGKFIREQQQVIGYDFSEEGLIPYQTEQRSPKVDQVIEANQTLIISAKTPTDNGQVRKLSDLTGNTENTLQLHLPKANEATDHEAVTLAAPLSLREGVVIGTLDFEITQDDTTWEEDQLRIVEAVANQTAQAIEAARLFEQTQAAREEAEALYQVGRLLVEAEDEQSMFHTVLDKMLFTLGLKQGGILFFDNEKKSGKLHALFENGKSIEVGHAARIPIADNASYDRLIETKKPLAIEDALNDPLLETVRAINKSRNVASLLLVPIFIKGEVIGAIGADAVGEKHIFSEWEISLASAMADQLAIMLQNHRLREETNHQALQLRTSADVSRAATSILDQDLMLDQAVELIKYHFSFYHVQIFLIDESKQYAVLHKSTGEAGQKLLAMNYKVKVGSQGVIGEVTSKCSSLVIRDANPLNLSMPDYHKFLPNSQAELAIPLQFAETLIGVLDIHSENPADFSKDDIIIMELLASQIAIAIQNARAFKEQQQTAERLKEVDRLKTQFLANMSHELRTPLNSIIGFSRVIIKGIDGPLTDLQKTDLTSIHNSGQHLLGLINNMLDLSKIEAGKMELNFEEVEIEPIIKSVMATALALVKDKSVELKQDLQGDLPVVWADATRLRQIILNLVSNACKFTDEGSVTLQATSDHKRLAISVIDTGVGIPEDQRESIFEEFTQVDASTTRKVGGTGLGLPISRHFVEMHKGKIWVEPNQDRGSILKFTIPITQQGELDFEINETSLSQVELDKKNKTIVAIDDEPDVINLYQRFLEGQGYQVIGLSNTDDIITPIKNCNPGAILLDVVMPGKDGWSIIQELKEDTATKDIPVIMCSMKSQKKRGFSLGAADYLTKPINEDDLLRALERLDNHDKEQNKVLVIDDQADDILLIRRMLESQPNYSIIEAKSGPEGLFLVRKESPDLIILDLTMPEMDGFTVVEQLKNNETTRSIPIIIVSAKDLTSQETNFLNGQVEALLHKNLFTEKELLADVQQALLQIHQKDVIKI